MTGGATGTGAEGAAGAHAADTSDAAARAIAEDLLERTGAALLRRDADAFVAAFAVPHRLSTYDRSRILQDEDALRRVFHRMCDEFAAMGVTDITRECLSARFRDPDTIAQTYISHVMSGTRRLREPYPCFSVLVRQGGTWKVQSSDYALPATSGQARALMTGAPEPGGPTRGAAS